MKEYSYNPVTPDIAAEVGEICGPDNVLYDQPDKLERYAHDQVSEKKYAHLPELWLTSIRRRLSDSHCLDSPISLRSSTGSWRTSVTPRGC